MKNQKKAAQAAQHEKKVTIELMRTFDAHIASLLRCNECSAYTHTVFVPTSLLGGITELSCTLSFAIQDEHTFKVPLKMMVSDGFTTIDVNSLCMAVAKEYEMLSRTKGFIYSALSELWIEDMKIVGDELIVEIDC